IAFSLFIGANSSAVAQQKERGIADFPKLNAETDWPWWRGPTRNGFAPAKATPPTKFSDSENVIWKTPIPGRGHSSPTVVGNYIFLTTADEKQQLQSVLAFDRTTGKQLWKTDISQS